MVLEFLVIRLPACLGIVPGVFSRVYGLVVKRIGRISDALPQQRVVVVEILQICVSPGGSSHLSPRVPRWTFEVPKWWKKSKTMSYDFLSNPSFRVRRDCFWCFLWTVTVAYEAYWADFRYGVWFKKYLGQHFVDFPS